MARITAGISSRMCPPSAAAIDLGKTQELLGATVRVHSSPPEVHGRATPDVVILVYNDHATSFSLDFIPRSPSCGG